MKNDQNGKTNVYFTTEFKLYLFIPSTFYLYITYALNVCFFQRIYQEPGIKNYQDTGPPGTPRRVGGDSNSKLLHTSDMGQQDGCQYRIRWNTKKGLEIHKDSPLDKS